MRSEHFCVISFVIIYSQQIHLLPNMSGSLLQQLAASLWISSLDKSVVATCSKSVERINADASCENQTCCNMIFADLLQVVETTCSKSADNKS